MWRTTRTLAVALTALFACTYLGCSVERENDQVSVAGQAGPCKAEDKVILTIECANGGELYCDQKKVIQLYSGGTGTDVSGICGSRSGFCINVVVKGPAVLMAYREASFEDFELTFEVVDNPATLEDEHVDPTTGAVFEVWAPAQIIVTVP